MCGDCVPRSLQLLRGRPHKCFYFPLSPVSSCWLERRLPWRSYRLRSPGDGTNNSRSLPLRRKACLPIFVDGILQWSNNTSSPQISHLAPSSICFQNTANTRSSVLPGLSHLATPIAPASVPVSTGLKLSVDLDPTHTQS